MSFQLRLTSHNVDGAQADESDGEVMLSTDSGCDEVAAAAVNIVLPSPSGYSFETVFR